MNLFDIYGKWYNTISTMRPAYSNVVIEDDSVVLLNHQHAFHATLDSNSLDLLNNVLEEKIVELKKYRYVHVVVPLEIKREDDYPANYPIEVKNKNPKWIIKFLIYTGGDYEIC